MLKNYLKIAWRNLLRNKAYAAINITGLSLGIACGILIFTVVNYHLSFDTFHKNKDRIYRVVTVFNEDNVNYSRGVPQPLGKAFKNDYALAEKIAMAATYSGALISLPAEKEVKKFDEDEGVVFAEPAYFDIFNFPLLQGNKSTVLAQPNSAIITSHLAKKYFGSDNVVGKVIRYRNKTDFKITGVLQDIPVNTDRKSEIYLSYSNLKDYQPRIASDSSWGSVSGSIECFMLLKPHVTKAQVDNIFPLLMSKYDGPEDAKITLLHLQPLSDVHFNPDYDGYVNKSYLWALFFIGLFLIVTACVNFINLATAQALNRSKEVGVRKVLGSLPYQLFWQFITETAIITLFADVLGCSISKLTISLLNQLFDTKMSLNFSYHGQLPLFLCILSIVVVFLSGSYPGLVMARFQPILALKSKLSQKHIGGISLRRILVVTQFAISQMLIIGTIVIASQVHYSKTSDLGFDKDAIVIVPIPGNDNAILTTMRNRLSAVPGIEKISYCFQPPASGSNNTTDVRYEGRAKKETWEINMKVADDQYLNTFGLKLVAGRNFYPSELDTINEVLVNEEAVKKFNLKHPSDILGRKIKANTDYFVTVVGVVKNFYNESFHGDLAPICISPTHKNYRVCAVKINGNNVKEELASIEKVWSQTFPDYIYSSSFLDERIAKFYKLDDIMLKLIEAFAGIAVFIGCLGLYGLVSYMAIRKTKEIGVRKVLGAGVQHILWIFGKEFSTLLLVAFVIAAPIAWWAMNAYLQDFKYRITIGAGIFLLAIASTFIVAMLTIGYRSVKAALLNPVKSLRSE